MPQIDHIERMPHHFFTVIVNRICMIGFRSSAGAPTGRASAPRECPLGRRVLGASNSQPAGRSHLQARQSKHLIVMRLLLNNGHHLIERTKKLLKCKLVQLYSLFIVTLSNVYLKKSKKKVLLFLTLIILRKKKCILTFVKKVIKKIIN